MNALTLRGRAIVSAVITLLVFGLILGNVCPSLAFDGDSMLLAQRVVVNGPGWGGAHWWIGVAIVLVVVAGAIAIVFLVFRHLGVSIPPVIQAIIWVAVVIAVAVVALIFLRSLL